jgi:hypothetical protein
MSKSDKGINPYESAMSTGFVSPLWGDPKQKSPSPPRSTWEVLAVRKSSKTLLQSPDYPSK